MKLVPEIAKPTTECPEPQRWNCYDGMSAEANELRQRMLDFDRNGQLSVVLLPTPRG